MPAASRPTEQSRAGAPTTTTEPSPPDGVFVSIGLGFSHSCGLRAGGEIECWGLNHVGQASNRLVGPIPVVLANLSSLQTLTLGGNQLSGEIPPALGSLAALEGLTLGGNQLSGEIPAALGSLSNLEFLHLSGNQLSGEIPAALGSLSNLEFLYLGDNQLSGCVPEALRRVPGGDLLDLRLPWCDE